MKKKRARVRLLITQSYHHQRRVWLIITTQELKTSQCLLNSATHLNCTTVRLLTTFQRVQSIIEQSRA